MTYEPVKRKVAVPNNVAGSSWPSEAPQPRIRARITSAAERPTLRTTKSNQSLRNGSRPSSPAPPVPNGFLPNARAKVTAFVGGKRSPSPQPPTYGSSPSPPYASSSTKTSPVTRQPGPRAKSPAFKGYDNGVGRFDEGRKTPLPNPSGYERPRTAMGFPSSDLVRTKSGGAKSVVSEEKTRVRVQATSVTRAIPSRAATTPYDSFPSTPSGPSSVQLRRPSHSNRSSPGLTVPDQRMPRSPVDAQRLNPHVTTSLPPTPPLNPSLASSRSSARVLPANPHAHNPISPGTPNSPEMKTMALPVATPIRGFDQLDLRKMSFDETSRSSFDSEWKSPSRPPNDLGKTQISPVHNQRHSVEVVLNAEAEEARINRKIADLEISNASLLAINRTLEANKAKQRSEINRLRGLLQEALSGTSLDISSHSVLFSGTEGFADTEMDGELEDPALEERWGRMEELLGNMRRHGERCLEDLRAPVAGGAKRVLEWTEVDRPESPVGPESELVDSPKPDEESDGASFYST